MDTGNSFKSHSKVEEEQAFRKKTRKRLIIIVLCTVVLVTITIGALVGTLGPINNKDNIISSPTFSADPIKAMCNVTRYSDSCYSSMSSTLKASSNNVTNPNPKPNELFLLSLQVALNELTKLSSLPQWILASQSYSNETNDPLVRSALLDCETLFLDAVDRINESTSSMQVGQGEKTMFLTSKMNDIRTWLSTATTDQDTCMDGLQEAGKHLILTDEVRYVMTNSTEFTSNSLAIASNVLTIPHDLKIPIHRKLLKVVDNGPDHDNLGMDFPRWVRQKDRRLLQEENPKPNLTVAKDGSGDFKTIIEAVNSIPKKSKSRFVIHVKEGVYVENVIVGDNYWNVMVYGDGMNRTVVSGSLNKVDGVSTFFSGTFSKHL